MLILSNFFRESYSNKRPPTALFSLGGTPRRYVEERKRKRKNEINYNVNSSVKRKPNVLSRPMNEKYANLGQIP